MTVAFDLTGPLVTPREAATVVLVRDGAHGLEVFFVKRRATVAFMGGAYVFPGGKLDGGDRDPALACDLTGDEAAMRLQESDPALARALYIAAMRECFEEAGVLFACEPLTAEVVRALRMQCRDDPHAWTQMLRARRVTLRASALVPFARWITPRGETRRFDARFFLAAMPAQSDASHDEGETVASAWLTPAHALERARAGEIMLVPPTWRTVEQLAQQRDVTAALAMAPSVIPCLEPVVHPATPEGVWIAFPGDPLHPLPEPVLAAPGTLDVRPLVRRFRIDSTGWHTESS